MLFVMFRNILQHSTESLSLMSPAEFRILCFLDQCCFTTIPSMHYANPSTNVEVHKYRCDIWLPISNASYLASFCINQIVG